MNGVIDIFVKCSDVSSTQDLLGGIHDPSGDREGEVRTFALAIGPRRTIRLSILAFIFATLAGALLLATGCVGRPHSSIIWRGVSPHTFKVNVRRCERERPM